MTEPAPGIHSPRPLVPPGFPLPLRHETAAFTLLPLLPDLHELDYRAVMASADRLHDMFGLPWPRPGLNRAQNQRSIAEHWRAFVHRESFTYAALSPDQRAVLGCVYLFPPDIHRCDVRVYLWALPEDPPDGRDAALYHLVRAWLPACWPFRHPLYPGRREDGHWYPLHGQAV